MAKVNRLLVGVIAILATGCQAAGAATIEPANRPDFSVADRDRAQVARRVQCMRDLGGWDENVIWINPTYQPIGFTMATQDTAIGDAVREAMFYCLEQYPALPIDNLISQAHAEAYYLALIEAGRCLNDLGFPISEPPSRQVIVDDAMALPIGAWDPWHEIMWMDGDSWLEAIRQCPQPDIFDFVAWVN